MEDKRIKYKIRRGVKTKRLTISVHSDSRVIVSAPMRLSEKTIEAFLLKKIDWIKRSVSFYAKRANKLPSFELDKEKKEEIKNFIKSKLDELNKTYNFEYNNIYIKNHSSRWGSCSSKKNINFNYRIINLPEDLSEYIISHELCHLGEMNHSKRFWNLVAKTIPDHKKRRAELKKIIF